MKLPRLRFSILSLMGLIAVVAVSITAWQRYVAWSEARQQFGELVIELTFAYQPPQSRYEELRDLVKQFPPLARQDGMVTWASRFADLETVRTFLDAGADPNERTKPHSHTLAGPLPAAVQRNNVELARLLIARGADPFQRDADSSSDHPGRTLLHASTRWGYVAMSQALLAEGLDVNAQTDGGQTPLHHAAMYHDLETIEFLLQQHPKFSPDDHGDTPLDIARQTRIKYAAKESYQPYLDECDAIIRRLEAYSQAIANQPKSGAGP